MPSMRVLLTGAAGRLGVACIPALHYHGHKVYAFVRTPSKLNSTLSNLCTEVIQGDARSELDLTNAITEHKIEAVINCAGITPMFSIDPGFPIIFESTLKACASVKDRRIRLWILNDFAMLDLPPCYGAAAKDAEGNPRLIKEYLPKIFPVHRTTYPLAMATSTDSVAWSMMCPTEMNHKIWPRSDDAVKWKDFMADETLRYDEYAELSSPLGCAASVLDVEGPVPPGWTETALWIPWLGKWINAFWNGLSAATRYEDVADFMAVDLKEYGVESPLVGAKVGVREKAVPLSREESEERRGKTKTT